MIETAATTSARHATTTGRERFLADVLRGLRQRRKELPCKYFYDEWGSALFDQICELDEYYLTRAELAILQQHAPEMAHSLGEDCALVEFGSGSSTKTRLLLAQLPKPHAYFPVDISREHLERSALALARCFPGLRVHPIAADFTAIPTIARELGTGGRRVVYFPGSTIGNFGPGAATELLRSIARLVGVGGGLLIGFDLEKDRDILLPAYNDRQGITAEFNLNLLARINRELGADFDLDAFAHQAVYLPEKGRIEMHLISRKNQIVQLAGIPLVFREWEAILTECSYKHSRESFRRLTAAAGFTLAREWTDPQGLFAVQYLSVP